jgi:hypothetical protein
VISVCERSENSSDGDGKNGEKQNFTVQCQLFVIVAKTQHVFLEGSFGEEAGDSKVR